MMTPGSRPTSTARVIEEVPKRSRTPFHRRVEPGRLRLVQRQRELGRVRVLEVGERQADQRDPLELDQRHHPRQ